MPISDATLNQPINWHDTDLWPFLDELQGNILKGHGRDRTLNHFLSFDVTKIERVKAQIRALGTQTTSALRQLNEGEAFRKFDRPGGTNIFFFLTASGYNKLGKTPPTGGAFAAGMSNRALNDPPPAAWEAHLRPGIDALLIVADDSVAKVANAAATLSVSFAANGLRILGIDAGHALRSEPSINEPKGRGIEHFGYVDGRSQPLMLTADIQVEKVHNGGIDRWDPSFGPGQAALVRDPLGTTPDSYGSFLIYRKLEQNVKKFKERESDLADALHLEDEDRERAGAMVVGRFEDGTPLVLEKEARDFNPTPNNFDYSADTGGLKCPFHAHVRKINPRAGSDEQRSHLMPRRGIPFGDPDRDFEDEDNLPEGGVGLLFMAYNREIERQFEVTQSLWANDPTFPNGLAQGADPIIGQGLQPDPVWRPGYGEADGALPFAFEDFVTMRGGEYFFAPSRGFLKTVS